MPKGLLFDMDGVLVDSCAIHEGAFQRVLRAVGVDDFVYAPYAGMRTFEVMADVLRQRGRALAEERIRAVAAAKSELAARRMRELNPLFPHALEVLERLSARFVLALVSSGSEASVRGFVETNRLGRTFRAVVHGGDVANAKPAPDAYQEAARRIGLAPADCLVLEDADAGEAAGRAAGCDVWRIGADLSLGELPGRLELSECRTAKAPDELRRSQPERWTAVVPAAGRGTRLGSDRPKILFEVAGRMILDWLVDLLLPRCGSIVLVAAPWSADAISTAAAARSSRVRIAVQPEAIGMADAVERGLALVDTENVVVIWGDQAAVRGESLDLAIGLHEQSCALATVPTVWRRHPYVHLARDSAGRIVEVLQAREGDSMPSEGESDTGVFLFRTNALIRSVAAMRISGSGLGKATKEWNLLPVLSLLDTLPGNVLTAAIGTEEECVGVNTQAEASLIASILQARGARNRREEISA
jgi:bifunctional UDP-N-acetylglucosamine pyrophosphorylase/glucosamine-1-phosphate N-acetyltransferase